MSCTRHLLNVQWEHHSWQPRVTFAEYLNTRETNMWGRVVEGRSVRCHKHEVCSVCGATSGERECICDTDEGEQCAIRLDWLDESRNVTK